ncbi:Pro-kumamolisin, activation domain-containing protein [Mycena leptocephala]|nr:Pro-kumamolisin, activation domain-containing protein [Mycena leptocephala]
MVLAATLLAPLLLVAAAKPMGRRAMIVHESRPEPARGFVNSGVAPVAKELTLRIALKPNNIDGLHTALYTVSEPANPLYGQHLTPEEVAEFVKPTDETFSIVSEWLTENVISSKPVTSADDNSCDLWHARNSPRSRRNGPRPRRRLHQSPMRFPRRVILKLPPSVCRQVEEFKSCFFRSVDVLQAIYGIPTTVATQTANKLGVSGFLGQFANEADLGACPACRCFLQNFRRNGSTMPTFTLQTLDGGINTQTPADAGIEADLDTQYTIGLATGVPVIFISVGANNSDGVDGFLCNVSR